MSVRLWRLRRRAAILLGPVVLFFLYIFLIEPNWIEITHHDVWFKTLPPEFDGLVVAHLSDLHMASYGFRERRLLMALAKANPGLIVITGDFMTKKGDRAAVRRFLKDLQPLNTSFGVWAVLGNHEHTDPPVLGHEQMRQFFNEANVALLVNDAGRIGRGEDTLTLVGVDDPYTGHDRLGEALKGMQRTPFAVLLSHSPEIFFKADLARFDLVLAGHTHGGQVRLPWVGPVWLPEGSESYDAGWFSGNSAKMFVSRGIGMSILPIRFLCRPELPLITLRRGTGPNAG